MSLDKKIEEARKHFKPEFGYLHQTREFYDAWDAAREAYRIDKLFDGTQGVEKVDEFGHPNNQADGNYE